MAPPTHHSVTDSPTAADLRRAEDDANSHVTRGEFRALRSDVHEIKNALMGTLEKPGFLEKFRTMQQRIGLASKLAWAAFIGIGALLGKAAWDRLTGHSQ